MAFTVARSPRYLRTSIYRRPQSDFAGNPKIISLHLRLKSLSFLPLLLASRRTPGFSQGTGNLADGPRNWSRSITREGFDDDVEVDEDDEEEEEEDRSLDLLVRFVQNVFRKISKRARKAVRSVLPLSIPSNLVGFSVNGVLILAFLWVLKAFLEVVCTLGSAVFISILLIRGIWMGVSYVQETRERRINELVDDQGMWNGARPAT